MEKNLFELWGNTFLTAARGQKQMEDTAKWMKGGFCEIPDMSDMLGSLTGINAIISSSTEYLKILNMASENFHEIIQGIFVYDGSCPQERLRFSS